jgi:hypothetical protein
MSGHHEWLVTPTGVPAVSSRLGRLHEGQRLLAELRRRAWTMMAIARELETSDSAVFDYYRGRRAPTRTRIAQLRKLAGEL